MGKPLPQDYTPSNPPTNFKNWHRWIVEELHRIGIKFRDNPVLVTVRTTGQSIDISPVFTLEPLGVGVEPLVDFPGGNYDDLTGIWTCPLNGIYLITAAVEIAPFGTGNKSYQADLIIYKDGIEAGRAVDTAVDDVPLSVNLNAPVVFADGDEIRLDVGTIHAQFTGTTTYNYSFSAVRLGSAN